jgi:hypothetical protein
MHTVERPQFDVWVVTDQALVLLALVVLALLAQ